MTDEQKWLNERTEKQTIFFDKVRSLSFEKEIEFVSLEFSDSFQNDSEDWPSDHLEELYIEVDQKETDSVNKILGLYINGIPADFLYFFSMNYNFGLVKMKKKVFMSHWKQILEIDGEEIFCYDPTNQNFLYLEKTHPLGRVVNVDEWIYGLTFSNKTLADRIKNSL